MRGPGNFGALTMPKGVVAGVTAMLLLSACSDGAQRVVEPPATLAPASRPVARVYHSTQVTTVGSTFSFDATAGGHAFESPDGLALTYTVHLTPHPNGLTVRDGVISGTPREALTMSVVVSARDTRGQSAQSSFRIIAFDSSLRTPLLPPVPYSYGELPAHFASRLAILQSDNTPPDNQHNDAVVALGRVLFYDRRLSANDRISCGSCHRQQFGFADTTRLSRGFAGELTSRNSMALANVRFYRPNRFFWDERATSLEALALMPVQNQVEMGLAIDNVVPKLQHAGFYQPLYDAAFGTPDITLERTSRAIAQFLRSIVSYRSKFDEPFLNGGIPETYGTLTAQEVQGMRIFEGQGRCLGCHTSITQHLVSARNTGLDFETTDPGAGNGVFKAPSLRNVAITGPYMHDGRFRTLEEVVDFYNEGVKPHPRLDNVLRELDFSPARLGLTAGERAALVAFLRTLTDEPLRTDPRFRDPFEPPRR